MIQRLYRLLLLFCSIAVFAACSDSDGNDNNGGNGGEIVPDGGDTYGYVTGANGNPVPGVVVSDGFTCTQTDAEGQYVLTRNAESGFVFYSLPSGYKVNMHKTYKLPKFFTKLKPETARYDFTLTALDAPETRFDLICIGDPQINEAAHAVRFKREAAKDIREYSYSRPSATTTTNSRRPTRRRPARNTKASSVRWTIRSTAATCISYRWTTSSTNVRRARVTPAVSAPSNTNG